jgi:hypothetical protein
MNSKIKLIISGLVLATCLFVFSPAAFAAPPSPEDRYVTQPSGEKLTTTLHGDEWFSWNENESGDVIIKCSDSYWHYAKYANGKLEALNEALRNGQGRAATSVFQEMVGLTEQPGALIQGFTNILLGLYHDFHIPAFYGFVKWLKNHPADDIAIPALEPVEPLIQRIEEWNRLLREIAGEQVARTFKDHIQNRRINDALETARQILMNGSEAGRMILPKICVSLAPSACATSTSARLTFRTPP